jgi:hypothetical protein
MVMMVIINVDISEIYLNTMLKIVPFFSSGIGRSGTKISKELAGLIYKQFGLMYKQFGQFVKSKPIHGIFVDVGCNGRHVAV